MTPPNQHSLFERIELVDERSLMLRGYQGEAIDEVDHAFKHGKRAPLLVLPTGSGKTIVAAELIRREVLNGGRALFLAPRRELIYQASAKLDIAHVPHGVVLAGEESLRNSYATAQVASVDTLRSRLRRKRIVFANFSLVIVDEAHLSITKRQRELLDVWSDARRVGLTATPTRKDGRALGTFYDLLIEPTTTARLVNQGYLAPARYFSIAEPDLRHVRISAGDYNSQELAAVVNRPELVGDVVQTWLQRAGGRRTVCFAVNVAHSAALCEAFLRAGVAAEHLDANTPVPMRRATFARFASGATQVLTNVNLASYGFDLPQLSCVVVVRPTKSLMLWLQMIGRGLRIAPDKNDCLVLDHAGNVHRHGFADDERQWTLGGRWALDEPQRRLCKPPRGAQQITCPECSAVFRSARTCPDCGFYFAPIGKQIKTLDGELVEIGTDLPVEDQDRLCFYLELRGYAHERGYRRGWAMHQYREKFDDLPPDEWNAQPAAFPSLVTRRWIKSRVIRWRKGRERAGGQGEIPRWSDSP